MLSDELGMQLHDRETMGEPLTAQEKAQIETWYAQKDAAESAMFAATQVLLPNLAVLQNQVDTVISQLAADVQRLQQITKISHCVPRSLYNNSENSHANHHRPTSRP